jgi:hypothetical protein
MQSSPAAVLTSQLCKIDIKGDKKDQWMRLPEPESSVTQQARTGHKAVQHVKIHRVVGRR